jgi:hypothetical protein
LGWGEKGETVDWQVEIQVVGGKLIDVEPRFRGHDIVAPQADEKESYAFSQWEQVRENQISFSTRTWGNMTTTSAGTQGVALEIFGDDDTILQGRINGQGVEVRLADLRDGPKSGYLGGFLTPAFVFHQAVPDSRTTAWIDFTHQTETQNRDWYYVRVRQHNGQWAWSSPIWIEKYPV